MTARSYSMRGRLLALLLLVICVAWIAVAFLTYRDAHRRIDALLDAHLAQAARLVVAQGGRELQEIDVDHDDDEHERYSPAVAFQVWERGDHLVLRSAGAPAERLSAVDAGFSQSEVEGTRWRVFASWDAKHEVLVQVAEDHAARERIARSVARSALLPLAAALPLLALAIWLVVGRGVRPLQLLGEEVAARGPQDLEPLDPRHMPVEVARLASRLDQLFSRIRDSMESERRFTSHAAHELRTPIAAIRAQAEVARATGSAQERAAALDHVIEACDRAGRLVEQLLLLARADEAGAAMARKPCELRALAEGVLAGIAPAALRQGTALSLEAPGSCSVAGEPSLLEALVRNLVDNALKHGGPGGEVEVSLASVGGEVLLAVQDTGPGVADADLPRLGQRFHRAEDARAPGSGLGLSIVTRIAELHGGRAQFGRGRGGRGLRVEVTLPSQA